MKHFFAIALCIFFTAQLQAQSFAINTDGSTANSSSLLDVKSTDKGVLIPRMSKAQKNTIASPATGLLIFQNSPDSVGFYYYNGSNWLWLATANNITGWSTTGNAGTDTAVNFIGTTTTMPLRFKQNSQWTGQLNSNTANYFIGADAGKNNTLGTNNIGFGSGALNNNTTSVGNTSVGDSALYTQSFNNSNTAFISYNTAIGSKALYNNQPSSAFDGIYNTASGSEALFKNTTGIGNSALGYAASRENTTGYYNVAIGVSALSNIIKGGNNTAVGTGAGSGFAGSSDSVSLTTFIGNSAGGFNSRDKVVGIGYGALTFNGLGSTNLNEGKENTAVGFSAMQFFTKGSRNTALGHNAMFGLSGSGSTGNDNIGIGDSTLAGTTSAFSNVAVGNYALSKNKTASRNVAIGDSAMYSQSFTNANVSYFQDNTAIGSKALFYNQPTTSINGAKNTAIGSEALYLNTTGQENTAMGTGALHNNITGSGNTATGRSSNRLSKSGFYNSYFGFESGYTDSTGSTNTGLGAFAMREHRSGNSNVAIGYGALYNDTTGSNKVAIGGQALFNDRSTTLPNTAVGQNALGSTSTGNGNTAIGYSAAITNSTGSRNTIIGYEAAPGGNASGVTAVGFMAAKGSFNGSNIVAIGDSALYASTQANNMAVGSQALRNLNGGNSNTALGKRAMYNAVGNTQNVAVGQSALDSLSSGNLNTAVGYNTGFFSTGSSHTLMGWNANVLINGLSNATAIGANAAAAQSNSLILGSISGINSAAATINVGIGNNTPDARLHIVRNGASGGSYLASGLIIEDNATSYIQLSHPNTAQTGIFSGNASTTNRSGITFNADSSVNILAGGNTPRMYVSNIGNIGINESSPDARLHIVRNGSSGGTYQSESGLIMENSSIFTMQFSTPNGSPALIRSGNASTPQRSGITFEADSSINFNSGGSLNRMIIDNTGYIGVRTSTPASYLDVAGSAGNAISTSTASTTLDDQDHTHIILPTASAVVITLPAASSCTRREYTIVNQDNSVQAISSYLDFTGAASITLLANSSITIQSNGTSWYRIR